MRESQGALRSPGGRRTGSPVRTIPSGRPGPATGAGCSEPGDGRGGRRAAAAAGDDDGGGGDDASEPGAAAVAAAVAGAGVDGSGASGAAAGLPHALRPS